MIVIFAIIILKIIVFIIENLSQTYVLKMITLTNNFLREKIINLPRFFKKTLSMILDSVLCVIASYLALSVGLEKLIIFDKEFVIISLFSIIVAIPVFFLSGIYKNISRFNSIHLNLFLIKAIFLYSLTLQILLISQNQQISCNQLFY